MNAENYFADLMKQRAAGKTVLSYGCVRGQELMPALVASRPQKILVIDISAKEIEETKKDWGSAAEFIVMDGHKLTFPSASFDAVLGRAILHHLDYPTAIKEIDRVLKTGGSAIFIEPLRDNPLLKLARILTPSARTKDELPISKDQIVFADHVFGEEHHLFYNFVSIPVGVFSSLFLKTPDNFLMHLSHKIDQAIARTLFKYWMRSVVLVWKKTSK